MHYHMFEHPAMPIYERGVPFEKISTVLANFFSLVMQGSRIYHLHAQDIVSSYTSNV